MEFFRELLLLDREWFALVNNYLQAHPDAARFVKPGAEWLIFIIGGASLFSLWPKTSMIEKYVMSDLHEPRTWFFPSGAPPLVKRPVQAPSHFTDLFPLCVAVVASLVGYMVRTGAANSIGRLRPYQGIESVQVFTTGGVGYAFPSGHATVAFAIACAIVPERPLLGTILLIGAAVVAASRVAAGVHYPLDVVAGAVLGALIAWGTRVIMGRWRGRMRLSLN